MELYVLVFALGDVHELCEKLRISKMLILIMEFVMFKNTWMTLLLKYVPVCNALIGNYYFKLDFELAFIANHLK